MERRDFFISPSVVKLLSRLAFKTRGMSFRPMLDSETRLDYKLDAVRGNTMQPGQSSYSFRYGMLTAVLAVLSITASAQGAPITVRLEPDPGDLSKSSHSFYGQHSTTVADLPPGVTAKSAVVLITDDNTGRKPFVLDPKKGPGKQQALIWGDLNGNGRYEPNEFITVSGDSERDLKTDPFFLIVTDGGHRHRIGAHMELNHYGDSWFGSIVMPFAFKGIMPLGDHPWEIKVHNEDSSGIIADAMNSNRNAKFCYRPAGSTNRWDEMPLKKVMGIAGSLYDVALHFQGSPEAPSLNLALTPAECPIGFLAPTGTNIESLLLEDGQRVVRLDHPGPTVMVPTGTWNVTEVTIKQGDVDFSGAKSLPGPPVNIEAGQVVKLAEGGPIHYDVLVAGNVYGASVTLNMGKATGLGGREYQPQGERPPLKWNLRRPGGKSLDCGVFEYG